MSSPAAAEQPVEHGGSEAAPSPGKRLRADGEVACSEDQQSSSAADTGVKARDTAATATTAQQRAVAPPASATPASAEADTVPAAEDAATAAEDGTDGARKRKKRTNSTFEESAEGWWKPLKWLTQCDPVKLHRHTLEWIELVRRCGHAQKRSGHNLNAYAGSKPTSLLLTVLDLQLPPPPPRLSPRKSAPRESATAELATHTEQAETFSSSTPTAAAEAGAADTVATDAAMTSPEVSACSSAAEKLSPDAHDEDEDNVARVPTPQHDNARQEP